MRDVALISLELTSEAMMGASDIDAVSELTGMMSSRA